LIKSIKETVGYDFFAKLLYRASKDGWEPEDFHRHCDEKGALLILVKVENGRLCGGFCSISWKSSGQFQQDPKSFLFSLDLLKKYSESKA
jgi:hypothetical protein